MSGLTCLDFPEGYCGGQIVLPAMGSSCGEVAGQDYCLQPCNAASDCRSGYLCAPVGSGGSKCIPPCVGDQDCGVGQVCGPKDFVKRRLA